MNNDSLLLYELSCIWHLITTVKIKQLTSGVVVLSSIVKSLLILGMWSLPRDIRRLHHGYCKSAIV